MERYLFRVQYDYPDGTQSYESVCVSSESEADAIEQVEDATDRWRLASRATRTLTLVLETADA